MPKFTIIVPVYNTEKYLSECLDSLINQTYEDIEIICINDGSTDGSLGILNEYAQKDSRIKIINQANQGVSVARNTGIENAKGDYILFVDSDDWLELNTCEKFNDVLFSDIDMLFYNYKIRKADGSTIIEKQINQCIVNKKIKFYDYIEECFTCLNLRGILGKVYKREFLKQNNIQFLSDLWFGEDTYYLMRNLVNNPQVYILDDCLYNYRNFSLNSLSNKACEMQYKQLMLLLHYFNNLFDHDSNKLLEFCANNDTFNVLLYLFRDIYFTSYKNEYLLSIKSIHEKLNGYQLSTAKYRKNMKTYAFQKILTKFHMSWLFWKIIFPISKYFCVLPYRKLFLREKYYEN